MNSGIPAITVLSVIFMLQLTNWLSVKGALRHLTLEDGGYVIVLNSNDCTTAVVAKEKCETRVNQVTEEYNLQWYFLPFCRSDIAGKRKQRKNTPIGAMKHALNFLMALPPPFQVPIWISN